MFLHHSANRLIHPEYGAGRQPVHRFFGAGGVLQLVVAAANERFPRHRGVITSVVMIASSVANYAMVSLAGLLTRTGGANGPRLVLLLNMAVTLLGVLLVLSLNRMQTRETPQIANRTL